MWAVVPKTNKQYGMLDGIWLARELFGGINVFRKGYHARTPFVKGWEA
jgi:hypothetical protein